MPAETIDVGAEASMRELYTANGYDPDALVHPKDVTPEMVTPGTVVVGYTVMRNPDPDAPATAYYLEEFEVSPDDVWTVEKLEDETDGAVSYHDDEIDHCVKWAHQHGLPATIAIGHGDTFYTENADDDPMRWQRTVGNVRGTSRDYLRFKLPN